MRRRFDELTQDTGEGGPRANALAVGEVVLLVRGDGPREGAEMGYATITKCDDAKGELEFDAHGGFGPDERRLGVM